MDIEQVLKEAGFYPILRRGRNFLVRCPNPEHDDTHPSCAVDAHTGKFKCWVCDDVYRIRGTLPYLVRLKTGCSWAKAVAVTGGEAKLTDSIKTLKDRLVRDKVYLKEQWEDAEPTIIPLPEEAMPILPVNALTLPYYNYLANRGVNRSAIHFFGLQYCRKGLYAGRVLVPVTLKNKPRGFIARIIDKDLGIPMSDRPYLNSKAMRGESLLFNYDNIVPNSPVIVVEGCLDAIHLWQLGRHNPILKNAVALLTSRITPHKLDLLVSLEPTIVYWMLDADVHPGDKEGKFDANRRLLDMVFDDVRYVQLDPGKDPDNYDLDGIIEKMENAKVHFPSRQISRLKSRV